MHFAISGMVFCLDLCLYFSFPLVPFLGVISLFNKKVM
jgi:hypothetical protein